MSTAFTAHAAAWWPYLFIFIAGSLATDVWRWIGVLAGNRLRNDSEALRWIRAVATALIAAVIGKMVVFPSGSAAEIPMVLRLAAAAGGWTAFMLVRRNILVGVAVGELILLGGALLFVT